uniref:EGF-like domain-containing protein n=1 Tax=Magallana gigas TaxID=29159 RepID=K1R1S6_MAGGI
MAKLLRAVLTGVTFTFPSTWVKNLALHQPTWEEYPWPDKGRDFGSENAVDGLYDDRGMGGQCTISEDGKYNATWRVDLGVCNNNAYGPACSLNCGNCSNGEACHHINGTCLHGCAEGTIGDTCQEGRCNGGCKPGWTGNTCNQIRATNTQPCSCTESYTIMFVVVSVLIVVTGTWKICRNLQVKEFYTKKAWLLSVDLDAAVSLYMFLGIGW